MKFILSVNYWCHYLLFIKYLNISVKPTNVLDLRNYSTNNKHLSCVPWARWAKSHSCVGTVITSQSHKLRSYVALSKQIIHPGRWIITQPYFFLINWSCFRKGTRYKGHICILEFKNIVSITKMTRAHRSSSFKVRSAGYLLFLSLLTSLLNILYCTSVERSLPC